MQGGIFLLAFKVALNATELVVMIVLRTTLLDRISFNMQGLFTASISFGSFQVVPWRREGVVRVMMGMMSKGLGVERIPFPLLASFFLHG